MKSIKILGFYLAISRKPLRTRTKKGRSLTRLEAKQSRLTLAGNICEICGRDIDLRCSLHHTLPVGSENRNAVENLMVLCTHCHHELEKNPHYHGLRHMEDESRYDGNTPSVADAAS